MNNWLRMALAGTLLLLGGCAKIEATDRARCEQLFQYAPGPADTLKILMSGYGWCEKYIVRYRR